MSRQSIIKGAVILTLANVITRLIGFFYRVYMAKTLGAEGMGLYQLVLPLYLLAWSISSSGISTTMSKLTSQENARKANGNINLILKYGILLSFSLSVMLSLITYFFSKEISLNLLKDIRASYSLKIISFCFPFMALGSVLRGYFLGLKNTTISALSQVLEQLTRIFLIYLTSSYFVPLGIEYACGCAVLGMAVGEIISFLYVFFTYLFHKKEKKKKTLSNKSALIMLLSMAVPLTLNKMVGSAFATAENILLPQSLQKYGLTQGEALSLLGSLSGMAMPLITFPSSLLQALATATMPVISENYALKNIQNIKSALKQSLTFTAIISTYTTALFIAYPSQISSLVYSQEQIGNLLKILAILCPFIYLQVTLSAALNGIGEQLFIFKIGVFSSLLNLFSLFFVVTKYGIFGFLTSCIFTSILVSFATIFRINKTLKLNLPILSPYIKPTLCIIFSVLVSNFCLKLPFEKNENVIITLFSASLIYTFLIFQLGVIKKEDISLK